MKKIITLVLLVILALIGTSDTYAYSNFQSIDKVGNGKFLKEFSSDDYYEYYSKIPNHEFLGWTSYHANFEMKVKFISETLFSYYNNGKSALQYNYKSSKKHVDSYSLKVSGGIKLKTQKNNKTFGDGLDTSINIEYKKEIKTEENESYDIKVSIEPGTQLVLYLYGEGLVTNGVAREFFFWFEVNRGGYEVFMLTTHYQRLEILPI